MKPTLYKKISNTDALNRNMQSVSESEKTQINSVLLRFVELFKEKHL